MAQWIWYPRDYEFYLGLKMYSYRTERGAIITPNWDVNSFHNNVLFFRDFTLEEDTYVKIHTTGTLCIHLGAWYVPYDEEKGLKIPKGHHIICIIVFSKECVPALYIDHPILATGEGWMAASNKNDVKPAAYWNFNTPEKSPAEFSFSYERINPVFSEKVNGGIFYDFGQEIMAQIWAEEVSGTGTVILCLGESREEALDKENCTIIQKKNIIGAGRNVTLMETAQAFRYLWIENDQEVQIKAVYANYEFLPMENRGAFRCSNEQLNQMYDIAAHTLHLCTREFCLDGIKRDRWAWSGDATQSYLLQYYSFFDVDAIKRTMRLLGGKEHRVLHINTIQDYTLYWFISLGDYYQYTGDGRFLEEIYPLASSMMKDLCLDLTDERGFLMPREFDWVFIDWSKVPDINVGDVSFIQILFARALEVMSLIADYVGDQKMHVHYQELHQNLLHEIFQVFWDDKKNCFTNGPKTNEKTAFVTKYANMFAMMFGYLDENQKQKMKENVFLNPDVPTIVTPYMKFYELAAMGELEMYEELDSYLKFYWGGMMEAGCTSFWEEYDPDMEGIEHYRQGTRKFGKSLCHAWGAGPLLLFGKYYLGVTPVEPGYKTFRVEPRLVGGLSHLEGTVPFPIGEVAVSLTKEKCVVKNDSDFQGTLVLNQKMISLAPRSQVEVAVEKE